MISNLSQLPFSALFDEEFSSDAPLCSWSAARSASRMHGLYEHVTGTPLPGNPECTVSGHDHGRSGENSVPLARIQPLGLPFVDFQTVSQIGEGDWASDLVGWTVCADGTPGTLETESTKLATKHPAIYWNRNLANLSYFLDVQVKVDDGREAFAALRLYNGVTLVATDVRAMDSAYISWDLVEFNFDPIDIAAISYLSGDRVSLTFSAAPMAGVFSVGQWVTLEGSAIEANNGTWQVEDVLESGLNTTRLDLYMPGSSSANDEVSSAAELFRIPNHSISDGWLNLRLMGWVTDASDSIQFRDASAEHHVGSDETFNSTGWGEL